MTERSVASIVGRRVPRPVLGVPEPTVDDMLAWLGQHGDVECFYHGTVATDQKAMVRLRHFGTETRSVHREPTMHAALEAAVRVLCTTSSTVSAPSDPSGSGPTRPPKRKQPPPSRPEATTARDEREQPPPVQREWAAEQEAGCPAGNGNRWQG